MDAHGVLRAYLQVKQSGTLSLAMAEKEAFAV